MAIIKFSTSFHCKFFLAWKVVASDKLFIFILKSPSFSCASLDRESNSWNWRNSRLKERLHRTQIWLIFLAFSSALCLFKLILSNNESDRLLLKVIYVFKFSFAYYRRATHQTWKEKRNPQSCYWIRASQTSQSQGACALFSPLLFLRNVWCHAYCSFLLLKMSWRTEISATKSFNHLRFAFDSSFGKLIQSKLN